MAGVPLIRTPRSDLTVSSVRGYCSPPPPISYYRTQRDFRASEGAEQVASTLSCRYRPTLLIYCMSARYCSARYGGRNPYLYVTDIYIP